MNISSAWIDKTTYTFRPKFMSHQIEAIMHNLRKAVRRDANLIMFPELSIPHKALWDIRRFCIHEKIFVIGGFEYTSDMRNVCRIITPKGNVYEYSKIARSKYDHADLKVGDHIIVLTHTGYGDFIPLVCYDFTDSGILDRLRGYVDIALVVAANPDVQTFITRAKDTCFTNFCFVLICNTAEYGYSGVYGPVRKIGDRNKDRVIKQNGTPRESIVYSTIDVNHLKATSTTEEFTFMSKPASYEREVLSESFYKEKSKSTYDSSVLPLILIGAAIHESSNHDRWHRSNVAKLKILHELYVQPKRYEELVKISTVARGTFKALLNHLIETSYIHKISRQKYSLTDLGKKLYISLLQSLIPVTQVLIEKLYGYLETDTRMHLDNLKTTLNDPMQFGSYIPRLNELLDFVKEVAAKEFTSPEKILTSLEDLIRLEFR